GRVGRVLADELERAGVSFVVVEASADRASEADAKGLLTVIGNATEEATLDQAGATRAKTLATVLPDDALNVFITLTAQELNPKLEIIARAESPATERKLLRSGASKVVVPAALGAARISQLMTLPSAESLFSDDADLLGERLATIGLKMNQFRIEEDSPFAGRSIQDVAREARRGMLAVAIFTVDGQVEHQPDASRQLAPGETLVALCNRDDMERIAKRATGRTKMMYRGVTY
ncbi:MAG: potassium channel protein, partial [Acidobacteria bacterium]|nr:potassium channel protein [Acidobacteriota bacterium]